MTIRIILINTSHPGNIGAVARAMKTMRLQQLYLVAPHSFPHAEATARAAGADDILAKAVVVPNLDAALTDCQVIMGTSARSRTLALPVIDPKTAAQQIVTTSHNVALLFGRENSGLTNEELMRCNYHITIPTNDAFPSLNLAAAVQILSYEINMAQPTSKPTAPVNLASAEAMAHFYQHLEKVLTQTKFLHTANPGKLMLRLRRLFNRAACETTEINILRGILASFEEQR